MRLEKKAKKKVLYGIWKERKKKENNAKDEKRERKR